MSLPVRYARPAPSADHEGPIVEPVVNRFRFDPSASTTWVPGVLGVPGWSNGGWEPPGDGAGFSPPLPLGSPPASAPSRTPAEPPGDGITAAMCPSGDVAPP